MHCVVHLKLILFIILYVNCNGKIKKYFKKGTLKISCMGAWLKVAAKAGLC